MFGGPFLNAITSRLRAAVLLAVAFLPVAAFALQNAPTAPTNIIRAEGSGLRSDKGQVLCSLFSSATGFPGKPDTAIAHAQSPISHGRAFCEFPGIAPGTYAVSVFHDENSNGKMDTNLMGIPCEGVGASNNARGRLGPPKFDAAAFNFTGGSLEIKIAIACL
jgi:uncharacterized protein (DUF2141 family)